MGHCDYRAELLDPARPAGPYRLTSGRLQRSVLMCPVMAAATSTLQNAPYEYLTTGVNEPAGIPVHLLVLARPCPVEEGRPQGAAPQ